MGRINSEVGGGTGPVSEDSTGHPLLRQSWGHERLAALVSNTAQQAPSEQNDAALGLTSYWMGDFAAVDEILAAAAASSGDGPWSDEVASLLIVQRSLSALVASLRGNAAEADRLLSAALDPINGPPVNEVLVMALSMRAALCSGMQPDRAFDDVVRARRLSVELGDPDLLSVVALGEGWALSEVGRFAEAAHLLKEAASNLPVGLERSVAELRLAEVQMRMGDRSAARITIDRARQTFLDADARYWGARAALLTGSIDRDRGGRWLKLARELSLADPAYERLFLPIGRLTIDDASTPSVLRDEEPVVFLTRHAEGAVRLLALAGSDGMNSQELIEIFWPEAPPERQRARLRTLLWQVRNSLGADAWRVQRTRNQVLFDRTGVDVRETGTKEAIIREFADRRKS